MLPPSDWHPRESLLRLSEILRERVKEGYRLLQEDNNLPDSERFRLVFRRSLSDDMPSRDVLENVFVWLRLYAVGVASEVELKVRRIEKRLLIPREHKLHAYTIKEMQRAENYLMIVAQNLPNLNLNSRDQPGNGARQKKKKRGGQGIYDSRQDERIVAAWRSAKSQGTTKNAFIEERQLYRKRITGGRETITSVKQLNSVLATARAGKTSRSDSTRTSDSLRKQKFC
jgi:hypothetical protein